MGSNVFIFENRKKLKPLHPIEDIIPKTSVVSTNKRSQAGVSKVYLALSIWKATATMYTLHTITSPSPTNVCRCSSPLHLHWPAGT